jgi:hypothetical protein
VLHPQFPADAYLEGATTRQTQLSQDHRGPRAVLNALERLAGGLIYQGPACPGDGSFPSLTVNLSSDHGWFRHA